MSLFQKSVEKKYLNELDSALIDKKYAEFQDFFGNTERQENIRNAKEEQFQEGFLRELFVKIFDYTLNPELNFNLTTELKNISDSKKADGAILRNENAIAIIELKSTDTTDLGKVESQAFGYKNHHPKCVYVITSNFEKLRFYIQNAVNHFEFDLFKLTKEEFSLLWLCLAKENLLNDLPLKIKESSLAKEENITKQLYSDYSKFREALYQNLVKNNPEVDKLTLFKKTQKLIDRFLFIFFAEDKQLLPANSILQIIEKWKDDVDFGDVKSLYSLFRKYFHILNVGRPKSEKRQEIFAYNGGLFLTDEVLENVKIDDEVLKEHTLKLSNYDFDTEVDVNILGHIFEHSLGEIENVQAEIKGERVEQEKTKRKKDGIFYTPKYITKYIVENTIGKRCDEKRKELEIVDEEYAKGRKNRRKETIKELDAKLTSYREWLKSLTIIDPACGSGAFLNQALEFLIEEHRKIDELKAQLFGGGLIFSDITTEILEKNIYGVDINEESVEIAKLSLWLRTAQKGRKLNTLSNNIKCGNSIIDNPEIAGDKAFNWQNEFPEIFANGGFDVVIGNPPYGAEFNEVEKKYLKEIFSKSTTGKIDSYRIFIEKAFGLANKNGLISLIVPNTFLYNVQSYELRKLIISSTTIYDAVELRKNIFEDAPDVVTCIISLINKKTKYENFRARVAYYNIKYFDINNSIWDVDQLIPYSLIENDKDLKINLRTNVRFNSINNKLATFSKVGDFFNLRQGTKPYGVKDEKEIELISSFQKSAQWEKAINGRNISRYYIEFENEFVHRCKELHSVIDYEIVKGEKIYFQRMRKISLFPRIVACYDNEDYHGLYTCSVITQKEKSLDLKFLLGVLNSKLINLWYKYFDTDIEIKLTSVKQIPIPNISFEKQKPIIDKVESILSLKKEFNKIRMDLLFYLQNKFEINKPSSKLNNWTSLNPKEFLNELKKSQISLKLAEEVEMINFFNEQKKRAQSINNEINELDDSIDFLIFELFGLSEDEIKSLKNQ